MIRMGSVWAYCESYDTMLQAICASARLTVMLIAICYGQYLLAVGLPLTVICNEQYLLAVFLPLTAISNT